MNHPQQTVLAAEQSSHLKKALKRFDILFLIIAAVVSLETLGQVSTYGAEALTWALVLAIAFLDELIHGLRGGTPRYEKPPAATPEEIVNRAAESGL